MKQLNTHTLFLSSLSLLLITILSCGGGDDGPEPPTAQEEAFALLAGDWSLSNGGSVLLDGSDVSGNYPGFSLSFTDGGYTTTNAGDLFRSSGTWEWAGDSDRMIVVDDSKQVSISLLNETDFNFSFQLTGSGGEAAGLAGSYEVRLKKE